MLTRLQDRVEAATKKKATLEADVQKFVGFCDKLLFAIQEAKTRLNDCNKEVDVRGNFSPSLHSTPAFLFPSLYLY